MLLEEISHISGLQFEYTLYEDVEGVFASDADIIVGLSTSYMEEDMELSKPYLMSEAILYINSSANPYDLDNSIYAGIKGGSLPEGIKEENTIFFDSREEAIKAVAAGKADYGYGNSYSISYYLLKYDYNNIVIIPREQEAREYCIGLTREDKILLSIINKSIGEIEGNRMQTLILSETASIDRELSFSVLINKYGWQLLYLAVLIIILLTLAIIHTHNLRKKFRIQNEKYELLSNISNEFIYDYEFASKKLTISDKCQQVLGRENCLLIQDELGELLRQRREGHNVAVMEVVLDSGEKAILKTINTEIYHEGKAHSIIGKVVDISAEVAELESLVEQAQRDGLTRVYNPTTAREMINYKLRTRDESIKDALLVLDCDKFKEINDRYGHLAGDRVLESIGRKLADNFRDTDIIGRIGGDEFVIYMKNIPSIDVIYEKYKKLEEAYSQDNDLEFTMSAGAVIVEDETSYEELFKKADQALYQAKAQGQGRLAIYEGS